MHICSFCPKLCLHQGLDLFMPHLWPRQPLAVEARPETKCPASFSLPDDFANGSDCLCQSFPRQAPSSSSHHNSAFLPLMTHWAWLHNSHRHIVSTRICVFVRRIWVVEFKQRFFNYFLHAHLRKIMDSNVYTCRHTEPSLFHDCRISPSTPKSFYCNPLVSTPVLS